MKSIKDFIKDLQAIEREHPDAVVVVPGHPDSDGYFPADRELEVSTLVLMGPGYSWASAGTLFPEEEYPSFVGKPRFTCVKIG